MRSVVFVDGRVEVAERPDPQPGAGEVLVRVMAAGLNGADVLQRRGRYPPPPGFPDDMPGLEFAGEVVGVGPGASQDRLGTSVMGIVPAAAQSELVVAHQDQLLPVPRQMSLPQSGGFPEAFCTAYQALFHQGRLRAGDHVLVNGAAGGVGLAAIQLAVSTGATVVGSARNANAHQTIQQLGAEPTEPDSVDRLGPYDVVIETVGAPNLRPDLQALRRGGAIVVVGLGAGAKTEINLVHVLNASARISGTTLRAMGTVERLQLVHDVNRHVLPLVERGALRTVIARTFPLERAADAYDYFASPGKVGKVIMDLAN